MLMNDEYRPLEWARTATEELAKVGDSLSVRATGILATASIIIGVTAATQDIELTCVSIPLWIAVACYFGVLYTTARVLIPQDSPGVDSPAALYEYYRPLDSADKLEGLWRSAKDAYETIYTQVTHKGHHLRLAVCFLMAEVVVLLVWLFLVATLPSASTIP